MQRIRRIGLAAWVAVASLAVPCAGAADDAATAAAEGAAKKWLALVDSGDYAASWREASTLFRKQVSEPNWAAALSAARGPFGAFVSRKLESAEFRTSLPGAPDGAYVVLVFTSSFEKKKEATEKITPMKDPDGVWRVSGYFIQ